MNIVTHTETVPNGLRLTVVEEHKHGQSPGREWGAFSATSCDTVTAAVVVGDPHRTDGASGTLADAAVHGGALDEHLHNLRGPRVGAVLLRLTPPTGLRVAIVGQGAAYARHTDGTTTCHRPTEGTLTLPSTTQRIIIGAPGLRRDAELVLATAILTDPDPQHALRQMIRATEHGPVPGTHLLLELPTA
ncbi:hypothetical protein B4N89_45975 [Embleya scabrispora]|uniref:Uncharacterized protein n=1 Tax=Embleya scabrispora TaxID=159449 RepID=A0A1T3NJF3_9ACTN|nr:hypothetical protein [Embleya scabrispora]OPC76825.1 hypothetical protein B4N89_45975 [Embleya scabrispora]